MRNTKQAIPDTGISPVPGYDIRTEIVLHCSPRGEIILTIVDLDLTPPPSHHCDAMGCVAGDYHVLGRFTFDEMEAIMSDKRTITPL